MHTPSGEHRVSCTDGQPPEVTVEQHRPSFGPPALAGGEVMAALGLPEESVAAVAPIRPVSVSRPKLIVPPEDADAVHAGRPDFPALWEGDAMGQPSRLRAAALAGPHGITRTSVTGQAIRTGLDELDLEVVTRGRDLTEPELR